MVNPEPEHHAMSKRKDTLPSGADVTVSAVAEPSAVPSPAEKPGAPASGIVSPTTEIPLVPEMPKAATLPLNATAGAAKPDAPKTEISKSDTLKIDAPKADTPKVETPKTDMPKPDARKPDDSARPAVTVKPPVAAQKAAAASSPESSPARTRRFALLAASIALVAAFGAFAGALGAAGISRLSPASSDTTAGARAIEAETQRALKALAADIATLKANLGAGAKDSSAQFAKIADRLDRIERRTSAAADTTGSTTPARAAAAAVPEPRLPPTPRAADRQVVEGWVLRDIYDGRALVESRFGGLYEIGPGANLPGVGRVETIRRQDGRWVVVTSRGIIASYR
jgi:hypothetical protein